MRNVANAEETDEATGFEPAAPALGDSALQNFAAAEGTEQKPRSTTQLLSEATLKTMLAVREQQN